MSEERTPHTIRACTSDVPASGAGGSLLHSPETAIAKHAPWLDDARFRRVHATLREHAQLDVFRCHDLWDLVREMADVPGDILAVGVRDGGTAALLATAAAQLPGRRTTYLCDTFQDGADPRRDSGEHARASIKTLADLLTRTRTTNVHILKGVFPGETGGCIGGRTFCLCRIDVLVSRAAEEVLAWLWPRLCAGGAVVIEDGGDLSGGGFMRLIGGLASAPCLLVPPKPGGHAILMKAA